MFLPRQVNVRNRLTRRPSLSNKTPVDQEHKSINGSTSTSSTRLARSAFKNINDLKPEFIRAVECMIEVLFYRERETQKFHLTYLINKQEFWQGLKPSPTQANLKQCVKNLKNELFTFDEESHSIIRNEYKLDPNLDLFERIVYVEPFPATLSNKPFMLAGLLRECFSGFLPYLDIIPTPEGYAFVVLAHSISQETLTSLVIPQGWNLLSREEWTKREKMYMEYQADTMKSSSSAFFTEPIITNQSFRTNPDRASSSSVKYPESSERQFEPLEDDCKKSQTKHSESKRSFPKGLLTRLINLHPLTNKSTIQSLLRYVFSRQNPTATCEPMYIDYRKDETEAIVRWKSPEQAILCVSCFFNQKRKQDSHNDIRAHRKHNKTGPFISAELVEGSEEESYWNLIYGKVKI
ncbi:F-box protein Pof8 [Schizosaccharomyces cryophilus OY26]|uniref:F-box protein Pof8 n=1 Tax=Schizosaccharomyces cryophilus (strain OY26 / ATCC MYA-4695 / CBS 11777 / NBRC 106824 / NRRL Y48691) TaxID=653667 RepID=S9W447_SCHCR|nr:F-box protein Pof8 [Schizosaccharomyces cryophilus OY26]EPY52790.1 F-box protein Pof8 [Schizosaccharomyces cryophilus OY26]